MLHHQEIEIWNYRVHRYLSAMILLLILPFGLVQTKVGQSVSRVVNNIEIVISRNDHGIFPADPTVFLSIEVKELSLFYLSDECIAELLVIVEVQSELNRNQEPL